MSATRLGMHVSACTAHSGSAQLRRTGAAFSKGVLPWTQTSRLARGQGRAGQRIERFAAAPALVAAQFVGTAIAYDALASPVRAALVPTSGSLQQFNRLAGNCLRRQLVDDFHALRPRQSPDQRPHVLHIPLLHPPPRHHSWNCSMQSDDRQAQGANHHHYPTRNGHKKKRTGKPVRFCVGRSVGLSRSPGVQFLARRRATKPNAPRPASISA